MTDRDTAIEGVIRTWRDSLINLTGRNRLLNFTVTKSSTVEVTAPDASAVLARLNGARPLTFVALKPPLTAPAENDGQLVRLSDTDPAPGMWEDPRDRVTTDATLLGAQADPAGLRGALRTLSAKSNQTFMDTGLWTLYLAFGTLTWTEPDDPKLRLRSPLVLVPVVLHSTGPRSSPVLTLSQEDVVVNPALVLKMQVLGVTVPDVDLDDADAIEAYLSTLARLISRKDGWAVGREVYLSYFTFHKEAMYRDLLDNVESVLASEQVRALAGSGLSGQPVQFLFEPVADDQVDQVDPPEEAMLVLDADASQRAAVAAAMDGRSFVIDGPPGTGKSQTITNIIATLIPAGKSVLFVSEKAAALEVVKNRLEDVGLGSYVLELHSHKATRKEVAEELARAVTNRPKGPASLDPTSLQRLKKARLALSQYAAEMNRPHDPLGMTPHDAMGLVSRYEGLPPVRPCTGSLAGLRPGDVADLQDSAARLGQSWRPAQQGQNFLWRDVTRRTPMTYELTQVRDAIDQLRQVVAANDPVMVALGWDRPSDAEHLADLLTRWAARPSGAPTTWLETHDFTEVQLFASTLTSVLSHLRAAQRAARAECGDHWTRLTEGPSPEHFTELDNQLVSRNPPGPDITGMTVDRLGEAHSQLLVLDEVLLRVQAAAADLCSRLGLLTPRTVGEAAAVVDVERLSRNAHRPEGQWLRAEVDADVEAGLTALRSANDEFAAARSASSEFFADRVLDLDPEGLLSRFENVHTGLHKWGSAYRSDVRALGEASLPGIKGKRNIEHLPLAVSWQLAQQRRDGAEARYAALIGPRYQREETDWLALHDALETARAIARAANTSVVEQLAAAVSHGTQADPHRAELAETLGTDLDLIAASVRREDHVLNSQVGAQPFGELLDWASATRGTVIAAERATRNVEALLERPSPLTFGGAAHCTATAATARALEAQLQREDAAWSQVLDRAYRASDTDLDELAQCLNWTEQTRAALAQHDRWGSTHAGALTPDQLKALESSFPAAALTPALAGYRSAVAEVVGCFSEARSDELKVQLDSWVEGRDLITSMLEDSVGQDEWFSYRLAYEQLQNLGLHGVVDSAAAIRVSAYDVPHIVLRETMRRWVDEVLEARPVLRSARHSERDSLVEEFRQLDRQLIQATVGRVIEQANEFRPNSAHGHAGIILSEGRRKRGHMPIRELIGRTKDVSLVLKPVFMMSPLSVSQYLPPDLKFDVVIFDEASQVMPEDAVNCIYRGRATIIAGDEKQLPPTNFFTLGTTDEEEDWEEDQSSAKDFESVLSIAKGCGALTSLTLTWHYRSRHEALIAFSNNRFYGGNLVTFPRAPCR